MDDPKCTGSKRNKVMTVLFEIFMNLIALVLIALSASLVVNMDIANLLILLAGITTYRLLDYLGHKKFYE
jgi:hypothetical protein